jgi:hypothetical protein
MTEKTTERSPLSGLDEYPIHQIPEPLRIVSTSDARAYERYWFTAQDPASDVLLVTGFGFYPNMGTADAYAILVHEDQHTAVRAFRLLGDDRSFIRTGPLSAEPVEPFREWHLRLGDNPQGLTFDIRWRDTKRAVFHRIGGGGMDTSHHGRPALATSGYESFGRIEGAVTYQGKTLRLSPSATIGSRDHHWGTRQGVGGPGHMEPQERRSHLGQWVEFPSWSVWGWRCLWNIGDEEHPRATPVVPYSCRMRFDPETHHLIGGVISNRFPDGSVKEITYEQIGNRVAYLRTGMYMGPDQNGTPEENYFHGTYVGDDVVAGETYDLTDSKVRMRIAGFDDHLVIARCDGEETVGLLECCNPVLYEMCRDKVPGFSILED